MDVKFLSAVRSLSSQREGVKLENELSQLLAQLTGQPLPIKSVRDRFSTVNRHAKSGRIQVVRGVPGEETLLLSLKDLAAIIRAASASLSFADALAVTGFQPIRQRLVQQEGFKRDETLAMEQERESASAEDVRVAV